MTQFGYKLMSEEHGPKALVENTLLAEEEGFDFVSLSDHFHPWLKSQGHAPFAWSVLGAIAQATSRIGITTGLTCPIIRYHPAIIAQAAATIAIQSDDRFSLAIGAGERLNEHVTGARWPSIPERHAMLAEAIDIFRLLWTEGPHTYRGEHFVVDHAQIFDLPDKAVPIILGVSGPESLKLARDKADGIMTTDPDPDLGSGRGTQARSRQVSLLRLRLVGQQRIADRRGIRGGVEIRDAGRPGRKNTGWSRSGCPCESDSQGDERRLRPRGSGRHRP
jgi:G6PDH family F420-dependent oxidoreductase